jgi:hypothetical protein
MARGLGSIPRIRGTVTQARNEPGDDMSADRYTPTSGRTGHPTEGTGGTGNREGSPPGRRRPGLAPGALGWPWHPRRLATAWHRETRGGLVWGVGARSRRCPAAWQRSCDRGHGAHPASRRSTLLYRHVVITTSPGRRAGPLRAAAGLVVLPERCQNGHEWGPADHRVVGAVRLPARAGRPGAGGRRPGGAHGGVLQRRTRLPVGVVPAAVC